MSEKESSQKTMPRDSVDAAVKECINPVKPHPPEIIDLTIDSDSDDQSEVLIPAGDNRGGLGQQPYALEPAKVPVRENSLDNLIQRLITATGQEGLYNLGNNPAPFQPHSDPEFDCFLH